MISLKPILRGEGGFDLNDGKAVHITFGSLEFGIGLAKPPWPSWCHFGSRKPKTLQIRVLYLIAGMIYREPKDR